jgi:Arm DNA-binding domain
MSLNDRYIQSLKSGSKIYAKSDREGLSLEVHPSGSLSWRYRYRLHCKAEKVSLGSYPAVSLSAARKMRDEYAVMVAQGKSPAKHKQEVRYAMAQSTTVFEFGQRYVDEIVKRDRKDPQQIQAYLDNDIYPRLAGNAMKDVTPSDVQTIVFRKRDGGSPSSALLSRTNTQSD